MKLAKIIVTLSIINHGIENYRVSYVDIDISRIWKSIPELNRINKIEVNPWTTGNNCDVETYIKWDIDDGYSMIWIA